MKNIPCTFGPQGELYLASEMPFASWQWAKKSGLIDYQDGMTRVCKPLAECNSLLTSVQLVLASDEKAMPYKHTPTEKTDKATVTRRKGMTLAQQAKQWARENKPAASAVDAYGVTAKLAQAIVDACNRKDGAAVIAAVHALASSKVTFPS